MGTVGTRQGLWETHWPSVAAWGLGVALCLVQYLARGAYWVDELAIVRNLADRSTGQLLSQPLDYDQMAPSAFLLVQQTLARVAGYGEFVLRLYALLMACIALAAMLHLGRRLLPDRGVLVPALLLGMSGQFLWLSSQVKPYSGDVAMIAVLLSLALTVEKWRDRPGLRRCAVALGAIAPWFAQPALFAIPALALAVAWHDVERHRRIGRWSVGVVIGWGVSAILALVVARARIDPGTLSFMRDFWRHGFAPIPPSSWNELKWPVHVMRTVIADLSNQKWSYAYLGVAAVGAVAIWRRARRDAVLLVVPLLLAFVASALRQYPLERRLAFCLAPILAILVGSGFAAMLPSSVARTRWYARVATLAFFAPSLVGLLRNPPPYESQPVHALFAALRDQIGPGDRAFVPYGSWQAWMHYAPRYGLDSLPLTLGSCYDVDQRAYDEEIRALKGGGRTWILFVKAGRRTDPAAIERVADTIGRRIVRVERSARTVAGIPSHVTLMLYDFGKGGSDNSIAVTRWQSPPPFPPHPSDAACRGAAVPRSRSSAE